MALHRHRADQLVHPGGKALKGPMCKLCGTAHFGLCAASIKAAQSRIAVVTANTAVAVPPARAAERRAKKAAKRKPQRKPVAK